MLMHLYLGRRARGHLSGRCICQLSLGEAEAETFFATFFFRPFFFFVECRSGQRKTDSVKSAQLHKKSTHVKERKFQYLPGPPPSRPLALPFGLACRAKAIFCKWLT